MKFTVAGTATTVLLATGLGGCVIDPKFVEEDFGTSVRQMVQAQIADPEAASNPMAIGPEGHEGTAASEAILGYQQNSKREPGGAFNGTFIQFK